MKRYLKPRYILLGIVIIVFCFVPVVDMEYIVVVEEQVLEPYTVQEEVRELIGGGFQSSLENPREWVPIYRTVTKEVTKTRLVTRPVAETQTRRVSILRYLLR